MIEQLYQPHRAIHYQIIPPVRHHLSLLTSQYLLNQTQTRQDSNQTEVHVLRGTDQNETVDPQHI